MMANAPTIEQLRARAAAARMVRVTMDDRIEFAVALVLQGYSAPRAHDMAFHAFHAIEDHDGALQMLARHRQSRDETLPEGYQWLPHGSVCRCIRLWKSSTGRHACCRRLGDAA